MIYGLEAWDRFWSNVDASGDCWEWTAARTWDGYGKFSILRGARSRMAHRAAWEMLVGQIPDRHHIDHLCFNTGCVNPDHLEPMTPQVNADRARRMRAGRLAELRRAANG
jgi:hypothetical protein